MCKLIMNKISRQSVLYTCIRFNYMISKQSVSSNLLNFKTLSHIFCLLKEFKIADNTSICFGRVVSHFKKKTVFS